MANLNNIIHVDMDAFFASCEERENTSLRGKPVIVAGAAENRGVVSSANYIARGFGVRSAMPTGRALRLCPNAVVINPRHGSYVEVSRRVFEIFYSYTPDVEPLSVDEAFLDVEGSRRLFGGAVEIAEKIRADIKSQLDITASAGVAPNKFLAKLASGLKKPDGLTVIPHDRVFKIIDPLPVSALWGVGEVTAAKLEILGFKTIRDVRLAPEETLVREFGALGAHIAKLSRGEDERTVEPPGGRESVGREITFPEDVRSAAELERVLLELADDVASSLRAKKLKASAIQLKCRAADFTTATRRTTLEEPTDSTDAIFSEARRLFRERYAMPSTGLRLIGVAAQHLSDGANVQLTLFDAGKKKRLVDAAVDAVRAKMGDGAILRAANLRNDQ